MYFKVRCWIDRILLVFSTDGVDIAEELVEHSQEFSFPENQDIQVSTPPPLQDIHFSGISLPLSRVYTIQVSPL